MAKIVGQYPSRNVYAGNNSQDPIVFEYYCLIKTSYMICVHKCCLVDWYYTIIFTYKNIKISEPV